MFDDDENELSKIIAGALLIQPVGYCTIVFECDTINFFASLQAGEIVMALSGAEYGKTGRTITVLTQHGLRGKVLASRIPRGLSILT
jgi:hypothetical protein